MAVQDDETARAGVIDHEMMTRSPLLHRYKVRSGDTLGSLAEQVGLTWQQLAKLNFGTDVPSEINWYLEHFFVCKKKIGANFVFSDADKPGILLMPRTFEPAHRPSRGVVAVTRFLPED